jgi:site-specific recombinase XerD
MSLYKRKAESGAPYWYRFKISGVEFRGSTGTPDRREALRVEKAEREKAQKDAPARAARKADRSNDLTIGAVFARYLESHAKRLSWGEAVASHLDGALAILGPDLLIGDVSTNDISKVLEAYEATGVAPGTVNRRKDALRGVFHMARDTWDVPVQSIKWKQLKRKEPKDRVRWLSERETQDLLRLLPHHIKPMFLWSLSTGCRLNETETLTWDRVNIEAQVVEVLTKGGGTRFVHLNDMAIEILDALRRERGSERLVFDNTNRRKHWEAARLRAGIEDLRWHDCRHSFATKLGWAGATLQVIQHALGHSKIETTERYAHTVAKNVADAVRALPNPMHATDDEGGTKGGTRDK